MTKQSALKQLETVIGKLDYLNYHIEGGKLNDAMREVVYVRNNLQNNSISVRKISKK